MENVARGQRPPPVAAEQTERERAAAAQVLRHVEAAAHGEVGAVAGPCHGAEDERAARRNVDGAKPGHRHAVEGRAHVGAGEDDRGGGAELQRRTDGRALEPWRALRVTEQPVGEPKRKRVHGPGWGHADVPVADAPRPVLHGGLGAAVDDLDAGRDVSHPGEQARVHLPSHELRKRQRLAQVIEVGFHARDAAAGEGIDEPQPRLFSRGAVGDELGQQRVVKRRHLAAAIDGGFHADVLWQGHVGEEPGAGAKIAGRIFGVKAGLNGVAVRGRYGVERRGLAAGQSHHPLDEVDTGHLLGDAVLDLDAGVDLEEVEVAGTRIDDELDGARRPVARGGAQPGGRLAHGGGGFGGEPGRRRLFDDLLVAALQRAVA